MFFQLKRWLYDLWDWKLYRWEGWAGGYKADLMIKIELSGEASGEELKSWHRDIKKKVEALVEELEGDKHKVKFYRKPGTITLHVN